LLFFPEQKAEGNQTPAEYPAESSPARIFHRHTYQLFGQPFSDSPFVLETFLPDSVNPTVFLTAAPLRRPIHS
jgi:hypothetical protein